MVPQKQDIILKDFVYVGFAVRYLIGPVKFPLFFKNVA